MKCTTEELLQQYIDGECGPMESLAVQKHLAHCSHCSNRWKQQSARAEEIKQVLNLLSPHMPVIPPLPEAPAAPGKKYMHHILLPLAVAASLLLIISVLPFKGGNGLPVEHPLQTCFAAEVDANRPVHQQEFTITVISPEGKVSEIIVQ